MYYYHVLSHVLYDLPRRAHVCAHAHARGFMTPRETPFAFFFFFPSFVCVCVKNSDLAQGIAKFLWYGMVLGMGLRNGEICYPKKAFGEDFVFIDGRG